MGRCGKMKTNNELQPLSSDIPDEEPQNSLEDIPIFPKGNKHDLLLQRKRRDKRNKFLCICGNLCCVCCVVVTLILALMITIAILVLSIIGYDMIFKVTHETSCKSSRNNNPSHFPINLGCTPMNLIDLSPYYISSEHWRHVSFPSTIDGRLQSNITGYLFLQPTNQSSFESIPFLVGIHGYRGCKQDFNPLLGASMLWEAGYNVFIVELRNHGESALDLEYPYVTFGNREHFDVQSGIKFLEDSFPHLRDNNTKMGVFGCSMGGAISLLMLGIENRFKASFVDAPACSIYDIGYIRAQRILNIPLLPEFLLFVLRLRGLIANPLNPGPPFELEAFRIVEKPQLMSGKHIFYQQTPDDMVVPYEAAKSCVDNAEKSGANVTRFIATALPPEERANYGPSCDEHCYLWIKDPELFQRRIISFFNHHLPLP